MIKNLDLSYLIDFYGDVLTEKQLDIITQYYNDDLSLSEIAENFGITRQGVRDSIKRGETILLDLEEKIGFASYSQRVQENLAKLETLAKDIEQRNNFGFNKDDEIAKSTTDMIDIIQSFSD